MLVLASSTHDLVIFKEDILISYYKNKFCDFDY